MTAQSRTSSRAHGMAGVSTSRMLRKFLAGAGLVAVAIATTGCTSTKSTNTPRTSTEQLLISNAVDQALDKIDFSPFAGTAVYVDDKYVDCVDSKYLVSSVRHRVLRAGGELVTKPEDARVVIELRNGTVGTESSESFVGVPEIVLPGMLTLPEIQLVSRIRQNGVAKIGLVAIDSESRQILGDGGVTSALSDSNNWYVAGIGPIQQGTIRSELQQSLTQYPPAHVTPVPKHVAFSHPSLLTPEPPVEPDQEFRLTSQQNTSEEPARVSLQPSTLPPAE